MILYRWQISRQIIDGIDLTRVHFFRSEWWFGLLTITNYLQSQMRDSKHLHRRRIHILVKSQRELIWQELTLSRIMVHLQSGLGLDNYIHKYKLFTISNEKLQASSLTTTSTNFLANHCTRRNHLTSHKSRLFEKWSNRYVRQVSAYFINYTIQAG